MATVRPGQRDRPGVRPLVGIVSSREFLDCLGEEDEVGELIGGVDHPPLATFVGETEAREETE